jgi:Carboxypeptidase regulatory-like domain
VDPNSIQPSQSSEEKLASDDRRAAELGEWPPTRMGDSNQMNWEIAARTRELDLREREVVAREREVTAKENELRKSAWSNPLFLGLIAALLALVGTLGGTLLNAWNARELEHQHLQSDLVLEAMRTGSPEKACTNLIAFINLQLLDDKNETIRKNCESSPATAPYLPASGISSNSLPGLTGGSLLTNPLPGLPAAINSFTNPNSEFNFQGLVVEASTGAPIPGADVSIDQVGNVLGKTKTGPFGQFGLSLPPLAFGTLAVVKAEREGFEPGASSVILTQSGTTTIVLRKK